MRVGLLAATSIDNAGDILLGHAVREALGARLPGAELVSFAPRFPNAAWQHDFSDVVPVPPSARMGWVAEHRLDALVIGGGGVISLHPWFRPFLLGDAARWQGPRAAWNAVCSQNTPWYAASDEERRLVREACARLAYVSVRNATTEKLVRRCGFAGAVHVVPDPTLGMTPPEAELPELPEGFRIGLSLGNAYADPRAAGFHTALFTALDKLAAAYDAEIFLFPFGNVYGEAKHHPAAAARLARCRLIDAPLSAAARWRLVGRMNLYVGARLHAVLAALAQSVPFLAVDEYLSDEVASSKIRELLTAGDLELHWTSPFLARDPGPKLAAIAARGPTFAPLVEGWRRAVAAHHDALVAAITS